MAKQAIMYQFADGMGVGPSRQSADVRIVNMYHVPTQGGRSDFALCDLVGSTVVNSVTPDSGVGGNGSWVSSTGPDGVPLAYHVIGNVLYRRSNGAMIRVGAVTSGSKRVSYAENQDQTQNVYGYVCDGYTVFAWKLKETDANVASTFLELDMPFVNGSSTEKAVASYITYNTYRLIISCSNAVQWYYSELNSNEFKSKNFEGSESNPDSTIRCMTFAGGLWVFSQFSFDIFGYTSSANNPFDVVSGGTGKVGLASGDSLVVSGDSMLWLGNVHGGARQVFAAGPGGAVKTVSTPGIDRIIEGWQGAQESIGFAFVMNGQRLYALTSKRDKSTLVYNMTADKWTMFSSTANGGDDYWDVADIVADYSGTVYFVPMRSSKVCKFNALSRTDYAGNPVSRWWQDPVAINGLNRFKLLSAKLDMEVGTALNTSVPQIFAQFSWNGGETFGQRPLKRVGAIGEYCKQVEFVAMGSGYALVMRIGTSSEVPFILFQIRLEMEIFGR